MVLNGAIFTKLLIVITRMYGVEGSSKDEYFHEWGRPTDEKYFAESKEDSDSEIMLILHGNDENGKIGYGKILEKAQNKYLFTPSSEEGSEILIYHHGPNVKGVIDLLREKVKELYPSSNINEPVEYGGGGLHAAVIGLRKNLRENKSSFADEVIKIAKGSAFYLFLFHHFQQCLLGMHLNLSILIDDTDIISNPEDDQNKIIIESYKSYRQKIEEVFKGGELIKDLDLLKTNLSKQKTLDLEDEDIDRFLWWWKMSEKEEDLELGISFDSAASPQSNNIRELFSGDIESIIKNEKQPENLLKELQSELRLQSRSLDRIIFALNAGVEFNSNLKTTD